MAKKSSWKEVEGFRTEYVDSLLTVDSTAQVSLNLAEPEVQFKKLEDQNYLRTLSVLVSTSGGDDQILTHSDTVQLREIRKLRKSNYAELRGEHPSAWRKFLLPGIAIAGGISGIISLFYIRSR